jgi:uncharacterized HAD superfamily protein
MEAFMESEQNNLVLGLDLDGVITEFPDVFRQLTHCWPGRVVVITFRNDSEKASRDVIASGIRFDEIVLVSSFAEKVQVVRDRNIALYLDDQPEMLRGMPVGTATGLIRNAGNYDFSEGRWIMSDLTCRLV